MKIAFHKLLYISLSEQYLSVISGIDSIFNVAMVTKMAAKIG